jgi:hypothetical protein
MTHYIVTEKTPDTTTVIYVGRFRRLAAKHRKDHLSGLMEYTGQDEDDLKEDGVTVEMSQFQMGEAICLEL